MSTVATTRYDAVVLLGFGGPTNTAEIRPFLDRVLAGRPVPPSRYEEVVRHYFDIGGVSPYNEFTRRQAIGVQRALCEYGVDTPVMVAYRHVEPFIPDVMQSLARENARRICAIPLAPHQSAASWDAYVRGAQDALESIGGGAPIVDYIDPFFDHPSFIGAHADRLDDARAHLGGEDAHDAAIVFTAHSIPVATPGADLYVRQLQRTAEEIAAETRIARWEIAYQSRSGSPREPWLGPDVRDVMRGLPERGISAAIVAPIGFLCDHVEVLYDLDIDVKTIAHSVGVRMQRATAVNDHPGFTRMLAELTLARVQRAPGSEGA